MLFNSHADFCGLTDDQRSESYERWRVRSLSDPDRRVEDLLGSLSQGIWAASWMQDMHLAAWDLLFDPPQNGDSLPYYQSLDEALADIAELRRMTVDEGWWPHYGDSNGGVGWRVPIQQWSAEQPAGRRLDDLPAAGESRPRLDLSS